MQIALVAQLPFLLQAEPTQSLPLPPFGTQRICAQLYNKKQQLDQQFKDRVAPADLNATKWLGTKGNRARPAYLLLANNNPLWIGVNSVDGVTHWALHVHEEGVRRLDLSLKFVLGCLFGWVNVQ